MAATRRRILDYKPVTISGPINRNRARVLWVDDRLFIFWKEDEFEVYDGVPKPEQRSDRRSYTTTVTLHPAEEGQRAAHTQDATWAITGCNCGFPLGRVSTRRLLQQAERQLAARQTEKDKETEDA